MRPIISIVIAAYNAEQYIKETIESLLNQTFSKFEIILINDASTDDTLEIVQSYNDKRIRVVENPDNLGLARSLNKAITMVATPYIARMDADDICTPDRLEKQYNFMVQHPNIGGCFSWISRFSSDEKTDTNMEWGADRQCVSPQQIARFLPKSNCLAHPTAFFKTEIMQAFPYDESIAYGEDYELWLRMLTCGIKLGKVPEALLKYRVHPQSMTGQLQGRAKVKEANVIIRKHALRNAWQTHKKTHFGILYYLLKDIRKVRKLNKRYS